MPTLFAEERWTFSVSRAAAKWGSLLLPELECTERFCQVRFQFERRFYTPMKRRSIKETGFENSGEKPRETENLILCRGVQVPVDSELHSRLAAIADWAVLARMAKYNCENLAAECLVSKRQLERFFVAKFKRTPKEWMQILRMELARNLIEHGYTTKAVASELHYKGCCHFCREFRKYYGQNPQFYSPKPRCLVSSMKSPFAHPSV